MKGENTKYKVNVKSELIINISMWECPRQNMVSCKPTARRGYFVLWSVRP